MDGNGTTVSLPECDAGGGAAEFVVPILTGLLAIFVMLGVLLFCGSKRIGASLFEKTAIAEQSAQLALREAGKRGLFSFKSHRLTPTAHRGQVLFSGKYEPRNPHAAACHHLHGPHVPREPADRPARQCARASPLPSGCVRARAMADDFLMLADVQEVEDLTQIVRSSETLEALVNDILFISKMQTTGFELQPRPVELCELLEDITQLLALRWASKTVECVARLGVPEFGYHITADPLRLRQVLTNLSTNAMKFTDQGHVTLSAELVEVAPRSHPCVAAAVDPWVLPYLGLSIPPFLSLTQTTTTRRRIRLARPYRTCSFAWSTRALA